MTSGNSRFSSDIHHKLDMLEVFLDRLDHLAETEFIYWLEDKPNTLVAQWQREKLHPTNEQYQENHLYQASTTRKIQTMVADVALLLVRQIKEIPAQS